MKNIHERRIGMQIVDEQDFPEMLAKYIWLGNGVRSRHTVVCLHQRVLRRPPVVGGASHNTLLNSVLQKEANQGLHLPMGGDDGDLFGSKMFLGLGLGVPNTAAKMARLVEVCGGGVTIGKTEFHLEVYSSAPYEKLPVFGAVAYCQVRGGSSKLDIEVSDGHGPGGSPLSSMRPLANRMVRGAQGGGAASSSLGQVIKKAQEMMKDKIALQDMWQRHNLKRREAQKAVP